MDSDGCRSNDTQNGFDTKGHIGASRSVSRSTWTA